MDVERKEGFGSKMFEMGLERRSIGIKHEETDLNYLIIMKILV